MVNKYRGVGGGKNNDPYLPPIGSMDAMMLHFKEMYDAGIMAGFTPDQSMRMVLAAVQVGMQQTSKHQDETE